MGAVIDEDVLGFYVAVGDGETGEVVETSQNLVGVDFNEQGCELFFFNDLIEVITIVIHDEI
jgi:hypothetical protein